MISFIAYENGRVAESVDLSGAYVFGQDRIPVRADLAAAKGVRREGTKDFPPSRWRGSQCRLFGSMLPLRVFCAMLAGLRNRGNLVCTPNYVQSIVIDATTGRIGGNSMSAHMLSIISVFAIYLIFMLTIGVFFYRRPESISDYFIGDS